MASIGFDSGSAEPQLLNVNADVMACRLAAALKDCDLVIAGTTPGVLDADGAPVLFLDEDGINAALESGTATAGMIAKLSACRQALIDGVSSIRIIDGRALASGEALSQTPGTTLLVTAAVRQELPS